MFLPTKAEALGAALVYHDELAKSYTATSAFWQTVMYLLRKQRDPLLPEHCAAALREALYLRSLTKDSHVQQLSVR